MAYDVLVLFVPTYLGPNVIHVHCTVSRAFDGHHLAMQCNIISTAILNAIALQYHPHYLHAGHLGGGGVGAVCGEGDEAHVALGVAAVLEVSHDGHQTRILALQTGAQYLEDAPI